MRNLSLTLLAVILLFSHSPAVSHANDLSLAAASPVASVDAPIRQFSLATVERLGKEMYQQDSAAARATDILFQEVRNLADYPIRGWLVAKEDAGYVIVFVGEYDGEMRAVFEVRPDTPRSKRFHETGPRPLTPDEAGQFAARRNTFELIQHYCSDNYNTLILPDPESDSHLIYWIAATTDPDLLHLGGHYRFTLSGDWATILHADSLSKSCLTLNRKNRPERAAFFTTHLLSETPLETHVFMQLQNGMPFLVQTGKDTAWAIDKGKISPIPTTATGKTSE